MVSSYEFGLHTDTDEKKRWRRRANLCVFNWQSVWAPKLVRILNVLTLKMRHRFTRLHVDFPQFGIFLI
jgi:hypothetical protein